MTQLRDATVFVTGATSGFGAAAARRFAAAGARLVVCGRRAERLAQLQAELAVPVHTLTLDVRDRAAVAAAIAGLPPEFAEIDVLVNNAGLAAGLDPAQRADLDDWDRMVDTNIKGLLYITRAVLPGMVGRGRGHVINIGSIAGHDVYPGGNVYCATKFAVNALSRGLRMDLVATPVRVSTVDPGMVETEFSLVRFHGESDRAAAVYKGIAALTGDDVADAVVYCASRPAHVTIAEMIVMPTSQASPMLAHRTP